MPLTNPNVTPTNMELTPCLVNWNGVDLGGTLKNVKISIETKKADIKADQLGETILDRRVSGHAFKVETVLAEIKSKSVFKAAFPNMRLISAGNGAIYATSAVGSSDVALAQALILHPLSVASTNLDYNHKFYKAVPEEISEVVFGPTEQQGLKVVWHVFPDTSTNPPRFYFHGDPANGIVSASAAAPVFTGSGDGTMTSVTVFDGYTKTETITATCLGVPASNKSNWEVHGSVSGPLGIAEITSGSPGGTVTFTSAVISFVLTDGATDFVSGDVFTVATTASNYA